MARSSISVLCLLMTVLLANAVAAREWVTLDSPRADRRFLVHTPASVAPPTERAAVLVFHGGGGSAEGIARMTAMDMTANRHGFLAVYPEGTGPTPPRGLTWNAGDCCGAAARNAVDDVAYVAAVIDRLVQDHGVDPQRIYLTGHSNGAQISYRIACELADRIAAIAPNAGQDRAPDCSASKPVPTLHLHGTEDRCASYRAGSCGDCFGDLARALGRRAPPDSEQRMCADVPDMVFTRAQSSGCSETPTRIEVAEGAWCDVYTGCADAAEVRLCTLEGGGHTWPGGNYALPVCEQRPGGHLCTTWKEVVGEIHPGIDANEEMWNFFQRFRAPRRDVAR